MERAWRTDKALGWIRVGVGEGGARGELGGIVKQ